MPMAAGCASAIANGRRGEVLRSRASGSGSSTSTAIASRSSRSTSCPRLSRLRANPRVHLILENVERHRTERQDRVVEAPLVELRSERRFRLVAELQDGQLAKLVGQSLSRPADISVDLGLDLMLAECGVARQIVDRLLARPAVLVDSGVDDEPARAPHVVALLPELLVR